MVYHGPSKGCQACRKRRVKCDQDRPFCGACVRRKQQHACVYRDSFDLAHKASASRKHNEGSAIKPLDMFRYSKPMGEHGAVVRCDSVDYSRLLLAPSEDRELESLCFFFANYVNVPREARSNVFVESILPIYKQAPAGSPLKLATNAVAANISEMWRERGPDSELARATYSKAVTSLRHSFTDPRLAENTDLVLASIFMLDFYESLSRRFQQTDDMDMHLKAAMAIIQQAGKDKAISETSRRIFTALRSRYILFNLQARSPVELDKALLSIDEHDTLPGARLDIIMANLANILYDARTLVHVGAHPFTLSSSPSEGQSPCEMNYDLLLLRCMEVNSALDEWQGNLPQSWQPYRNTQPESLHHSIRAVGLYNGLCDVYSSTSVCHAYNGWRSNKIFVLCLIKHCLRHLPPSPSYKAFMTVAGTEGQIQSLVDDVCASVPFHLGSRTSVSLPHEHSEYPPVPLALRESADYVDSTGQSTTMTDQDHIRTAAATGGWFLLTPLSVILQYCMPSLLDSRRGVGPTAQGLRHVSDDLEPLKLRNGQAEWILGQVRRIRKLYRITFGGK